MTSLYVPKPITAGEPATFIAQVSPPAIRPGPREPTGTVEFLDGAKPIAGCLAQPIGPAGATCTTTYVSTRTQAITARYQGDSNFDPSASRPQTARVVARARITPTMRWSFSYTRTYTRVIGLILRGAAHTRVLVTCHGKGCPFGQRVLSTQRHTQCKRKRHGRCRQIKRSARTMNLARVFGRRRLGVGARIAVAITRPGWTGKYSRSRLVLAAYRESGSAVCRRGRRTPAEAVRPSPRGERGGRATQAILGSRRFSGRCRIGLTRSPGLRSAATCVL